MDFSADIASPELIIQVHNVPVRSRLEREFSKMTGYFVPENKPIHLYTFAQNSYPKITPLGKNCLGMKKTTKSVE